MNYRAVIFDLGGVVLGSPLQAIAAFERSHSLQRGFVAGVIRAGGDAGAWARMERGELPVLDFHSDFARECEAAGVAVDTRALLEGIAEASEARPQMLEAVARIRARGLLAAALTNNWAAEGAAVDVVARELGAHFDAVFESSRLKLRKPDPRIYRHACGELGVEPAETVFLDDIGQNLKSARALGMHTIKVEDPDLALAQLSDQLGFSLS